MNRKVKIAGLVLVCLLAILGIGFYFYANDYYAASSSLAGYKDIYQDLDMVKHPDYISLTGKDSAETGIIFYPGGKVEANAYLPLLAELAKEGYTTYLVEMPFNLAVFGINKAEDVIGENPQIKKWYIGGHSLGGAMASSYASKNEEKLEGIILLGSYPAADLSQSKLKLVSIYGDQDFVLNREKLESTKEQAPSDSFYYEMQGANHSGFGDYGQQEGDGVATLTREEQIAETVKLIVEKLN